MSKLTNINTADIKRKFPEWAKIDRVVNGLEIYNIEANILYCTSAGN